MADEHREVSLHGKAFLVHQDEFSLIHPEFSPLEIRKDLAELDREIAFIKELRALGFDIVLNGGYAYGGYVPITLGEIFQVYQVALDTEEDIFRANLAKNPSSVTVLSDGQIVNPDRKIIVRAEPGRGITEQIPDYEIIICNHSLSKPGYLIYPFQPGRYVHVKESSQESFQAHFKGYFSGYRLDYDNLVNLLIMVKNAGPGFAQVLRENLPYIDRWTVLDTGSTDQTPEIVREVLASKPGALYQEPFINFRDSRNRLLELADKSCVFNIMLDDTYVLQGDKLREFLTWARADEFADSYSLHIKEIDLMYTSNRITKASRGLKYKYRIHEIIEENKNVSIPLQYGHIQDYASDYMKERTQARKYRDLDWLLEELHDDPSDPRIYYYIAETYLNLEAYPQAFEYYEKRAKMEGFREEKQDALYKLAVLADLHLQQPWERCHELYLACYEYNPRRCESLFMIGRHYASAGNEATAMLHLEEAFKLGVPKNDNMNVKLALINEHLPRLLLALCHKRQRYDLGEQAARRLLTHAPDRLTAHWLDIFSVLNEPTSRSNFPLLNPDLPLGCFVCIGGWEAWNGKVLRQRGLGGTETCVIRFAEQLARSFNMHIFCKCDEPLIYQDVVYLPLRLYKTFLAQHRPALCVVHRSPEYLFLSVSQGVDTYLMLHDLIDPQTILPVNEHFKGVLCLTEWHKEFFTRIFPQFEAITKVVSYGIEVDEFPLPNKQPYSFIYSSFPNRGLLPLLEMFPFIHERYPEARLEVFCRFDLAYLDYCRKDMDRIQELLEEQKAYVTNHGWVSKGVLFDYWSKAQIWFYPCTFEETACLTAFEAAASRTLVITNHLAALRDTVGERGIIIPGDVKTDGWKTLALNRVFCALDGLESVPALLEANFEWAKDRGYDRVIQGFLQAVGHGDGKKDS